jgi:copper chaperone CopZ
MQKVTLSLPALYGDHHVLEVRKLLTVLPGVVEVYASSCFHVVEVSFDPTQVSAETISSKLETAGYLADLPSANEAVEPFPKRQATGYEQVRTSVSFAQTVSVQERPAWPCPGMGLLKVKEQNHA